MLLRKAWKNIFSLAARLYLRASGVQYGRGLKMTSFPLIRRHPAASIRIGERVTIQNLLSENRAGITHRSCLVAATEHSRIVIGNDVGLSGAIIFCDREIIIEDHVNLGVGAKIYDTDFHAMDWQARRRHDTGAIATAPVRICEDVWIGAEAKVMKGVTIGARSVIGAGSIVTRSIPPDCFAAGIPARVVHPLNGSTGNTDGDD